MVARHGPGKKAQRGIALLILLAFFVMGALTWLLGQASHFAAARDERAAMTSAVLAQAKEALVARAVLDASRPGSLPCPDLITNNPTFHNVPNDGIADSLVGSDCPSYVGRLPWKTLGLPDLRDTNGERVWYTLSRNLRDDDSAQPINSHTPGLLTVDSTADIAAIIFSPGPPLLGQGGRPSNSVTDYLDGTNANGDTAFAYDPPSGAFNDVLLTLPRTELMHAVEKRVSAEALKCLHDYASDGNGRYPWAASLTEPTSSPITDTDGVTFGRLPNTMPTSAASSGGTVMSATWQPSCQVNFPWWNNNGWRELVFYALAPAFGPSSVSGAACGTCLTMTPDPGTPTGRVAVVVAGAALAGQDRTLQSFVQNYLELENATPANLVFAHAGWFDASFNDVVSYE